MSKVRDISGLSNIIKTDANGNVTFVSGSTTLMSISSSGAVTSTGTIGGSNSTTLATTGSNTFTGQQYVSNTKAPVNFTDTASLYTDGGLRVGKDAYVSGTLYLNDLTVYGTQSINYITSSQLDISDNIITVNTSTPQIRFGGIAVRDSGSAGTGLTGSLLWDSQNNHWIYTNPSGSSYSGGMLISGPRNTGSMGDEQGTTLNALMKGMGGDHITSSGIFESGSNVGIGTTSPTSPLSLYAASTNADVNYIKMEMPSWGGSINYKKNIIWHDSGNVVGGIGMSFTSPYTYMDFHSFYNSAHTTGSLMRIQGNGNVGIGTTSPSKLLHLYNTAATDVMLVESTQVFSTIAFKSSTNSSTVTIGIDGAGNAAFENKLTTGAMAFVTNGSERMRITSGGNVGIGTNSPDWPLTIKTDASANSIKIIGRSGGDNALAFYGSDASTLYGHIDVGASYFQIHTSNSQAMQFYTGGSERMRITSAGNVGIGTSSPTVSQTGGGLALGDGTAQKGIRFNVESGGWGYIEYYEVSAAKWITGFRSADGSYNIKTGTNLSTGNGISIANTGITTINNTLILGTSNFVGSIQYGTSGYGTHDYNAGNGKFTWSSGAGATSGTIYYSFNADGTGAKFTVANNGAATLVGSLTQNTSDRRLKDNVKNIDNALNKVMSLNGVTFDWNDIAVEYGWSPRIKNNDIGVLAQEVQAVLPQAIDFAPFDRDDNQQSKSGENYLTVQYEKIVPLLIESIKELKAENDTLKEILQRNNIQ